MIAALPGDPGAARGGAQEAQGGAMESLIGVLFIIGILFGIFAWIGHSGRKAKEATEALRAAIDGMIKKHLLTLNRKRRQLIVTDDYGYQHHDGWIKETQYFLQVTGLANLEPVEDREWAATRLFELVRQTDGEMALTREARRAWIDDTIKKHLPTLKRKRRQLIITDDYGYQHPDGWIKEVQGFLQVTGLASLELVEDREWAAARLFELVPQTDGVAPAPQDVETLTPLDFEDHCADLLRQAGWTARRTQASGDQGVDIIAEKGRHKVALQCKRYAQPVGNFAVQEVVAGRIFYGASLAGVVSSAGFTPSARTLASVTGTLLLHYEDLVRLEELISKAEAMGRLASSDSDRGA